MQQETRIHCNVVGWWAVACAAYKLDARLLSHCPNGGKRGRTEAAIFKGMGVRAGIEDLFLSVPRADKHGLYLELKSPDGRIRPEQKEMMALHEQQGYAVAVAWTFEEGIGAIINYLKSGSPYLRA